MKRFADILEIILLVLMLGMCVIVLMAGNGRVPYFFGYRVMQVISDSMRPTIADETCIVIKRVEDISEIKEGDIITFLSEDPRIEGFYNTHRVNDVVTDSVTGETLFETKGDAHEYADAQLVQFEQVAGKYVGELPFGEYLYKGIIFLTNRVNYFIVVIAPLFVCFMSYVKQLLVAIFRSPEDYENINLDEDEEEIEDEDKEENKKEKRRWKRKRKEEEEEVVKTS